MSAPAYRFIERRQRMGGTGGNILFEGAKHSPDRRRVPKVDKDTANTISNWGWRQLMSGARYLWANFGPIRGGIRQMATYAVGCGFNVQYEGRNRAWGDLMERTILEHDKICDIRGHPFNFRTSLILDLVSIIRDGDATTLFTGTNPGAADDYPLLQSIPAHRIDGMSEDGSFPKVTNGIVQDDFSRTIAYRVTQGDSFRDIPAKDVLHTYSPEFCDQARGITWLAPVIPDCQDIFDIRQFTKTGIKAEASISLVEYNERGQPLDQSPIGGGPAVTGDPSSPFVETLDGGTVRYFRSNTGSKIEGVSSGRPSENSQKFSFEILRGAFEAIGWPIEFYDPTQLGGANIRLRVAQAKRTVEHLQEMAAEIARRKRLYTIAKLIKLGVLPMDEDWWMVKSQMPRDITVDNGRDTKADIDLYLKGAKSLDDLCAGMGEYWEDVQDQKIREEVRWQEECKANGIDPNNVRLLGQSSISQTIAPETAPTNEDLPANQ